MKALLVFSVVVGSGLLCWTQSPPAKSVPAPFRITVKPSTENVVSGTPIYLELKLLNESTETMVAASGFQTYAGDPSYGYNCRDSSGKSVSKEMPMVGSAHDPPSIKPGETYTSQIFLDRECDLSRPGRYEVQLSRGAPMGSRDHIVESNKIVITVIP